MLRERERVLERLPNLPHVRRQPVGIDLQYEDLAEVLCRTEDFRPERPTLFVPEGVSMYLEEPTMRRLLRSLAKVMRHGESRLWLDVVSRSVVDGTSGHATVESFVSGMARLGEPFVFGLDEAGSFFAELGFESLRVAASSSYQDRQASPICELYGFHVLRCCRADRPLARALPPIIPPAAALR